MMAVLHVSGFTKLSRSRTDVHQAPGAAAEPLAIRNKADVSCPTKLAAASRSCCAALSVGTGDADADDAHTPDASGPMSPVCPLMQAAQALSAATSGKTSTDDSGKSVAAPAAVVDSIAAVAALRRGHLRYRSACAAGTAPRRTQLHLKLPGVEPSELQPGFMATVNESLRALGSELRVVAAYVRRGCIELSLDLLDRGRAPTAVGGAAAAAASEDLDIPAIILSALSTPPPQPAGGGEQIVLVQRGDECWAVQWDADAMQWQLCARPDEPCGSEKDSGGDGGEGEGEEGTVALSAPAAVHAPVQLTAGAEVAGRPLRLALVVHGDVDFAAGGEPPRQQLAPPTIVAKANGRTVVTPIVTVAPRSGSGAAASVLHVELDLGQLAAGRPATSPGLVVRLELWRRGRCAARCSLAALRQEALVSELLQLQRDVAAAGELDPQDDAYLSAAAQRDEVEQLLGDLSSWLDFVAAAAAGDAAAAAAAAGERDDRGRDSLDLAGQVGRLLQQPEIQAMLLSAGQHLLEHFIYHGHVALARSVYGDLLPLATRAAAGGDGGELAAAGAAVLSALSAPRGGGGGATTGRRKTLLHRAVRSGSRAMVQQVLEWMYGTAAAADWGARGPGGVTPLHLLAADARCGCAPTAANVAVGGGAAGSAATADSEALLCWIIGTFPAAVTVWNTARDASGNTPARLWSALGGPDVQLLAAAAALEGHAIAAAAEAEPLAEAAGRVTGAAPASPPAARAASPASPAATVAAAAGGASVGAGDATPGAASAAAGSAAATKSAAAPAAAGTPGAADADMEAEAALVARPPSGLRGLVRLSLTGFPTAILERRYVDFVTHTTAASTLIWVVLMVLAHAAAFFKSLSTGEAQQALIGGAAYAAALVLMLGRPRLYAALREPLMLACLLGRTLCRLLMATLPGSFRMSDSVTKYILYGLDVLLDGFLEGTFEQVRITRAAVGRLLEAPITAAFMITAGVRPSYGTALLRAAAVSCAGLAMSALSDLRLRASFLRELRNARAGSGAGAGAASARGGQGPRGALAAAVKVKGE